MEGFYKDLNNLVVPVAAASSTANGQSYQNNGSGRVYGSEFLLRYKPEGRFFGWVAYTLSRSERRDAGGDALYTFDYDQTHILTALGSYKLGRGWQAGLRFRYVSGTPYTPELGGVMDYDAGSYAPNQFERSQLRTHRRLSPTRSAHRQNLDVQRLEAQRIPRRAEHLSTRKPRGRFLQLQLLEELEPDWDPVLADHRPARRTMKN